MWARQYFGALALLASMPLVLSFNNPPGVDIWCGKAYRASNASFKPGGWFEGPPRSSTPLLNLKVRPRMNIYLESDVDGSLLVDATVSYLTGEPLAGTADFISGRGKSNVTLDITSDGISIVSKQYSVTLDSHDNEIPINFTKFSPRLTPYNITVVATVSHGNTESKMKANTELYRLPQRTDGGSATRLDHLYGGLAVMKGKDTEWTPIFPYTYYVQWSLYWDANISTLDEFASRGYNVIHIVPTGALGNSPFPWDEFEPYLQRADELGLYFQYDVRWDYTNLTTMIDQVTHLRSHPSILLWYTGDEPDGKSNPINSTAIAYETIRQLDLYHPVSLALNCYNFYYEDYASGADIILSDVYPISTNTSWSTVYDTPCNTTYGCCGCDDCHGSFEDISDRLDNFAYFDEIIGWSKTHWGAPQAFGNETFWTRYPTADEEVTMTMLSINHAAKGIVMWDFPTSAEILNVTDSLASVLTSEEMTGFLVGAPINQQLDVYGGNRIDVAAWAKGDQLLMSILNLNYVDLAGEVIIRLPKGVSPWSAVSTLWGVPEWKVKDGALTTNGLGGLAVSILVIDLQ
ncbi:conserved hypothetical protein [Talaromyces stipitatus ATCC 10500]|uniref:Glycoside hydrolase subgroup catalytic core protein n=1 Tax=Talaromyces stipitatus (strain ATCC 10500 / CBS 375.48 / QM 6759 / NRRL 1006) TaxID=441959 RepID=B8MLP4_TALSN|nr:uncharacterized protein TSTA_101470 [Talaromyces stipitatus ATCC 10500]EED13907.1 conserved hypothetical protein [Talaromyces stipitatus ATCC 10500]